MPVRADSGLSALFLWRESNDQSAYPIIETYIENRTDQDIEFEKIWINGKEAKGGTAEYCWIECYPKSVAKPGEILLVQVCLMTPQGYLYDTERAKVTTNKNQVFKAVPALIIKPVGGGCSEAETLL